MNRRQISALLVLERLGVERKMDSFAARLSVQKSVYLAQAAGVDVGHYFNWYLRGPYSPTLTQDVFDAIQNGDPNAATEKWELDAKTQSKLTTLSKFLAPPETANLDRPAWLELLASVHFLVDRDQAPLEPASLKSLLERFKKHFTRPQVATAIKVLTKAGLLSPSAA